MKELKVAFREFGKFSILLLFYVEFCSMDASFFEEDLSPLEKWTLILGIIAWGVMLVVLVSLKLLLRQKFAAPNQTRLEQTLPTINTQNANRKETYMKGTVLDFSIQTNAGLISGEDGKRFSFVGSEWKESAHPAKGMVVDFEPRENLAVGIYFVSGGNVPTVGVGAGQKRPVAYQGFYKSTDDKVFAGVCGGLGHKWNVSPIGLRIVFVILGLIYFLGVIIYIALWIILKGVPTKNVKFDD
jgi:phage shock protein PspC (stress-responsive transcriptional regulator)